MKKYNHGIGVIGLISFGLGMLEPGLLWIIVGISLIIIWAYLFFRKPKPVIFSSEDSSHDENNTTTPLSAKDEEFIQFMHEMAKESKIPNEFKDAKAFFMTNFQNMVFRYITDKKKSAFMANNIPKTIERATLTYINKS